MADFHRQIVRQKLEALGYHVAEIQEGKEPSADLAAIGPDCGLVIEVKSRLDDLLAAREFHSGPPGQVVKSLSPIVHDDFLSDVVHHAAKQIGASQDHFSGLGVLWFRADPQLGISHSDEKMVTTLLGKRNIIVRAANGSISVTTCYFAGYADFYLYPAIDLAVVEDPEDNLQLIVNPYSRRLADVRTSRLVKAVADAKTGAMIDLHRLETPKDGYVLWGEFSRKQESTVLAELKRLYPDRDFQFFNMKSVIGRIRVNT